MKNLSAALATTALSTAFLAGCGSIPNQQNSGNNNAPEKKVGVTANADCTVSTANSAKNSVLGSDNACVEVTVYGTKTTAPQATPAAKPTTGSTPATAPQTKAERELRAAKVAGASAPKTQPTAQIVTEGTKAVYALALQDCGPQTTSIFSSVVGFGKAVGDKVVAAGSQAATMAAGRAGSAIIAPVPGVGRKVGQDVATTATRNAGTAAAPVTDRANAVVPEAVAKCNANLDIVTKELTTEVQALVKNWKTSNTGVTPVVTFNSTLPAQQEEVVKAGVAKAATIWTGSVPAPKVAP